MTLRQFTSPGPIRLEFAMDAQPPLQLDTLVRVLKERRWVLRGAWDGQAIYAKLFAGKEAARYARRDADGARRMLAAGIRTPALLWQGTLHDGTQPLAALIYAAVPNAVNAAEAYSVEPAEGRYALLALLVEALAAQHVAGLCQTDLHLKNFLLAEGVVWAIDGDGIRQQTLSRKQAHLQLAELISKLQVLDQMQWTQRLLDVYLHARGWPHSLTAAQVLAWAQQMKTREVEHYVTRKIFRTCSDVTWQQTAQSVQAVSIAGGLHPTDLPALEVAMHVGQILKAGNTCTVGHTQLQDQPVVIKRYNIKNAWHALSRAWRPSRAAASWQNAHRLQYYGMLTPQPMLMYERRYCGLRGRAYFVSAFSPWPDVLTFFQQSRDPALEAQVVEQLVMLCYQWYLLKISHGDLKGSNLQVTDQGQIVVIDLDSMRQHHCAQMALRAHARDLRRLLQNWKPDSSLYNALVDRFKTVYPDHTPLTLAGISI